MNQMSQKYKIKNLINNIYFRNYRTIILKYNVSKALLAKLAT